uniref:Thrombospondin-type laminin G domain and EAR repeat-containing protein-like n=1 Tax=Sinocyclocheilus grahami TaxID=75366 RepID=A0A672T0Z0_SINGR
YTVCIFKIFTCIDLYNLFYIYKFNRIFFLNMYMHKNEYLFAVVKEDVDQLLLGMRFSKEKVHLIYQGSMGRERLSFKRIHLADNRWHSMVLSISGHHATLTLDCGIPLELVHKQPFPSDLSTDGSRFHIGSRRKWKGLFSGLLRQLVLLAGSDATPRVCPSFKPSLVEFSIPTILSNLPVKSQLNDVLLPPYGCHLCWSVCHTKKDRLDYVDDYQDLYTTSETLDIELFQIPSVGLFAAMAHRANKPGSAIYRWNHGQFQLYQNISTFKAQAWKQFTIGRKMFLAVSNSVGPADGERELSVIYRWSNKRLKFVRYQTLETHSARDWEAFHINNENGNHNIDSVVYKWNPGTKTFEVNQTISTSGAYDWEFFTVGPYHFLAVANAFDGTSTQTDSSIYIWLGGAFQLYQTIRTFGATDWEMFQIGNRVFLALANGHMLCERGPSLYTINSTIYELDMTTKMFLKFQDIVTYSAVDWEFFSVGDEHFLVVANSYDGSSYSLNSVIYRCSWYCLINNNFLIYNN